MYIIILIIVMVLGGMRQVRLAVDDDAFICSFTDCVCEVILSLLIREREREREREGGGREAGRQAGQGGRERETDRDRES
jgi:hypothetical protein